VGRAVHGYDSIVLCMAVHAAHGCAWLCMLRMSQTRSMWGVHWFAQVSTGPEWGWVGYGWVQVLEYRGEGSMVLIPIKSLLPSTNQQHPQGQCTSRHHQTFGRVTRGVTLTTVRTTQRPTQIVLGLGALVLKGRTSDLGTWGKEKKISKIGTPRRE